MVRSKRLDCNGSAIEGPKQVDAFPVDAQDVIGGEGVFVLLAPDFFLKRAVKP